MSKILTFEKFIAESQNFDTKIVDHVSDLKIGDEVFQLGVWKVVHEIDGDRVTLVDPQTRFHSYLSQADLKRLGALVKVDSPNLNLGESQAEFGQPDVPEYSHINLPVTNQRVEGPVATEKAVRKLLERVVAEQQKFQEHYKGTQEEARNEASNILFNYSDELSGLGWSII